MDIDTSETSFPCASRLANVQPAYIAHGWQPTRTGNFEEDCAIGRTLARDIVSRMERDNNPLHLSAVARGIVEAGRWEAVEIGLFSTLAMMLTSAASIF